MQTFQKHLLHLFYLFIFLSRGNKNSGMITIYLSDLHFLSPFPSLPLADWLLNCCFLSRELQNSARARVMEITFLASLRGACTRPEVYFKCNWVWCVHKGKMVCSWLKWSTLFCFWVRCQTFSTARVYLLPFCLCASRAPLFGFDVIRTWGRRMRSGTCSTATFGNTPNSISFTARLMTMTTSQSKCKVKLLVVTSPLQTAHDSVTLFVLYWQRRSTGSVTPLLRM